MVDCTSLLKRRTRQKVPRVRIPPFPPMHIPQISAQDAYLRIQNGAILVDVRELDEFNEMSCDVEQNINVPMSQFQNAIQTLPKDKEIITICHSGGRSFVATQLLIAYGYSNVTNLVGGILSWQLVGLPTK